METWMELQNGNMMDSTYVHVTHKKRVATVTGMGTKDGEIDRTKQFLTQTNTGYSYQVLMMVRST